MLHFCHCTSDKTCSSITSVLLKSLPQPVKSINPSLLHSNHFNFKDGKSSSFFWDYFQFSVYSKLYIPSVKLFHTFLFWVSCIVRMCSILEKPVCMPDRSLQLSSKYRGLLYHSVQRRWHPQSSKELLLWFNPMPLARNTCKLQSNHNNCRHLNPQGLGSISLTCLSHASHIYFAFKFLLH